MKKLVLPALLAATALAIGGCSAPTTTGGTADKAKTVASSKSSTKPGVKTAAKPVSYKGHGDKVLKITKPEKGAVVVDYTHDGDANFIVTPLAGTTEELGGTVNTIGRYKGRVLLDGDDSAETTKLKIQANGTWTVQISPLTVIDKFSTTYSGKGDDVVAYTGKAGTIAMTHKGQANFIVGSSNDPMGLANEIGNYKGETTINDGPSVLDITADGTWTLKVTAG